MDAKNVLDVRKFSPDKLAKVNLVSTPRMACDVWGLGPGQEQAAHAHDGFDKLYYVVEGVGHFRIAGELREIGPGNIVHAPAGVDHGVRNEGAGTLTLLVVLAPRPA